MADLDDFFAKKDRKKNKYTKKYSTTEEVAKKLEDNAKKTEKQKKERVPEGEESNAPQHEQDEWKEFEEEKKDYSGLKIGNLTINSNSEGNTGNTESSSDQQQGSEESGLDSDKKTGPWNRVDVQAQEEAPKPVVVEKKPEPVAPSSKVTTNSVYIPPSMRNQPLQSTLMPSRLKSRAAPDIHNEEFFPTLSKTDHRKNRNEGSFEVVSHNKSSSHRHVEQNKLSSNQGAKLNLGNRYDSLRNDS